MAATTEVLERWAPLIDRATRAVIQSDNAAFMDVRQDVVIGILEALPAYDPERGTVGNWIALAAKNAAARSTSLPMHSVVGASQARRVSTALRAAGGDTDEAVRIAGRYGISSQDVAAALRMTGTTSLDELERDGETIPRSISTVERGFESVEDRIAAGQIVEVAGLTDRQREIIERTCGLNGRALEANAEAMESMGVPRSTFLRERKHALTILREHVVTEQAKAEAA